MAYAEKLSSREASDTIDIPISLPSGEIGRAQLLIGPASQLVVVPLEREGDAEATEIEDEATVSDLARRTAFHSSPRPQASDDADTTDYVDVNGFYESDHGSRS